MAILNRLSNLARGMVLVSRDGDRSDAEAALDAELAAARPAAKPVARPAAAPPAATERPEAALQAPELDEQGEVKRTL